MSPHPAWETLNEYVDGVLAADLRTGVTRHLGVCAECRARLTALEETLRDAAGMARELAPPDESWSAIRAEVERGKVVTLPGARVFAAQAPGMARRRWLMAAAVVGLMVGTSAVTTLVIRRGDGVPLVVATDSSPSAATLTSVSLQDVERGYLDSVRELSDAMNAARPQLSPETIAIVERNLTLIDAAITESRTALLRDPGNRVLQDVLAGTYRQKLDLLRRAAQLASS